MTDATLADFLRRPASPMRYRLTARGNLLQRGIIEQASYPFAVPLVSCLMVTRGGLFPARFAIDCFVRQTYERRELVVVCDAPDTPIETYCRALNDARIRFVYPAQTGKRLGELRNLSLQAARGEWVCQWDDDDLYHPMRIAAGMAVALTMQAQALFLSRWLLWSPHEHLIAISGEREWEGSMLAQRDKVPRYPELARGEDTAVAHALLSGDRSVLLDAPWLYTYIWTGRNTWGDAHMRAIWNAASFNDPPQDYAVTLAALDNLAPYAAYAAACETGCTATRSMPT